MNEPARAVPPSDDTDDVPVLAMEDIHKSFQTARGRLDILCGVDLTLRRGECIAMIAPSGAGKSTLLHIAGLLDRPSSGEVFLGTTACGALNDDARTALRRHAVGFVYQFHHLLAEFTALENVMMPQLIGGLSRRLARQRAGELLDYLKVGDRAEHRPVELSGGEQQRVAIARAVANRPDVLLADEPTGNLDPATAEHVFTALRRLVASAGLACLIATHNMEMARRMDRIVTLRQGRLEDTSGLIPTFAPS